jgi:hypothetical protein
LTQTLNHYGNEADPSKQKPLFWRVSPDLQKEIDSNYQSENWTVQSKPGDPNRKEAGLSVWDIKPDDVKTDAEKEAYAVLERALPYLHNQEMRFGTSSSLYLITGQTTGVGADGEPILDTKSVQILSRVKRSVLEKYWKQLLAE